MLAVIKHHRGLVGKHLGGLIQLYSTMLLILNYDKGNPECGFSKHVRSDEMKLMKHT